MAGSVLLQRHQLCSTKFSKPRLTTMAFIKHMPFSP